MLREHKIAIARLFSDLIDADHIIDLGEMNCWERVKQHYGIDSRIATESMSISLAQAVNTLGRDASLELRQGVLDDCKRMTVADGFCSLPECLIMNMLHVMLGDGWVPESTMVSVPRSPMFDIAPGTAIYVESRYDKATNLAIQQNFRSIFQEFQLAGMHFIYIPQVIYHYQQTDPELMRRIISFVAPRLTPETVEWVRKSLLAMTTATFCRDLLCNKMGLVNLRTVPPMLLIKVGNGLVGDVPVANHLCMPVGPDILTVVQSQLDHMSSMMRGDLAVVRTSRERNAQFHHGGFYKPLMDLFLAPTDIRSHVVLDPYRSEVSFPEVQQTLMGLSRREKALYVLLLCQGERGLNFNAPRNVQELARHEQLMRRIQTRYALIYGKFGGDRNSVPDLGQPEIRRPIFSRLKTALKQIKGLYNAQDYNLCKDDGGTFSVPLETELVKWVEMGHNDPVPLQESSIYQELQAL